VRNIGLFKSHFTGHWTGSRTWHEEAFTLVQTSPLSRYFNGETDLDREIGARLNRAQLEKAFEQLPEMQRATLELFYFEGLDLREISESSISLWGTVVTTSIVVWSG